jgi:hypothetical protein
LEEDIFFIDFELSFSVMRDDFSTIMVYRLNKGTVSEIPFVQTTPAAEIKFMILRVQEFPERIGIQVASRSVIQIDASSILTDGENCLDSRVHGSSTPLSVILIWVLPKYCIDKRKLENFDAITRNNAESPYHSLILSVVIDNV